MDIFDELRIPIPQAFESPSLTRVGRFQRGILTAALGVMSIAQAVQWQFSKQDNNLGSEFRCAFKDGVAERSAREDLTSRHFEEYRQKYTPVSQEGFLFFALLNLLIGCIYTSFVSERFSLWLQLNTSKQRGKIVVELKGSMAVFKAYSIQLCVKLVSALVFIIYSFLMSSVIIPSEREYSKQRTPTLPFVFSSSSVVTTIHCYADEAFKSSMFNTAVLTFVTFAGVLSLAEIVYAWQETKAFENISDYYFCMLLLRHNCVTESTNMVIEKELFIDKQRKTILEAIKHELRLPLGNCCSCPSAPCLPINNIFISQQKLKYKGVKKQRHKQELFRTYSSTKKLPVACLGDLFKPSRDSPNPKRILVTGDPGIGKTTLARTLVQEFNSKLSSDESEMGHLNFVFSFDFKELGVIHNKTTLQEFLSFSSVSPKLKDIVYRQIAANPGQVLLIFDGLNEWTVKTTKSIYPPDGEIEEDMSVDSVVFGLLSGELLPGCTMVVTSRSAPLLSEIDEIFTFDRYAEMGSFQFDMVKTYVQQFFQNRKDLSVMQLTNRISMDENLEVFYRVPQNCVLLCVYVNFMASKRLTEIFQATEIPSTTSGLLQKVIETATREQSVEINCRTPSTNNFHFSKNFQDALEKLSFLAYQGIIDQRYVFREEDLSRVQLSAFEVEILKDAGFLLRLRGIFPGQPENYFFSCLSIQEYLAACRMIKSMSIADFRDFLEIANETHWSTLLLVAGLCNNGKQSKGVFVCLMQYLIEAIKLNRLNDEPVIDNQAIVFLCKCLFENGTQLGHPFAREVTSLIPKAKPITFTEIGANPQKTQAIIDCLKGPMGENVKRVIFESNAMGDSGLRQVASFISDRSCKLNQVNLTNSCVTDDGMLSFLEITAGHSFIGIKVLGLRGNQISSEGAKYLACVLFNDWCQIEELHLGNNNIGDAGVEHLSEALCSGNSKIQTLDLSSNGITHNGVFHLSQALSSPICSVRRLFLQKNRMLDFGLQDLCQSLCSGDCNLRILYASSNEITDDGIRFVERALAHKSCALQELYLGYNQVTDKGVKSLLQALPNHQLTLKVLSLTNNPITDVGVKMLASALRNSSCNLHRLCISLGRAQLSTTKASKLQVRYVNAF